MNAIATDNIKQFVTNAADNIQDESFYLHPASITYIQNMLLPYADAIEKGEDKESIVSWVREVFDKSVADILLNDIADDIALLKYDIISGLVIRLLRQVVHVYVKDVDNSPLLPWDIQTALSENKETAKIIGLDINDKTSLELLPVTVTFGPQQFTHMLSEEFVAGLLLFSDPSVGNYDFHVTMYDTPILPFMRPQEDITNRFILRDMEKDLNRYRVTVNNITYVFDTPEFIQGFATGAQWASTDPHQYLSHLIQRNKQGIWEEITF